MHLLLLVLVTLDKGPTKPFGLELSDPKVLMRRHANRVDHQLDYQLCLPSSGHHAGCANTLVGTKTLPGLVTCCTEGS